MKLYLDDCFNVFPQLEDKSIDLILCDMPYGTTACKWDTVLNLDLMWKELERIVKDNTAIVLTARNPFTSVLICSNLKMYKYSWVWEKGSASNFMSAKFQPLDNTEDITVFSKGGTNVGSKTPCKYNPQDLIVINKERKNSKSVGGLLEDTAPKNKLRGDNYIQEVTNYPYKTLKFNREKNYQHPTQKPVTLMEYLIKTYSNEGDTVLDFCMGSGTTGVACKNLNRQFIGIEKEEKYFQIAKERTGL